MKKELVSEWGSIYREGNKALKIFPSAQRKRVAETARLQALARAAGLPVPAAYGIRRVGMTKIALVMDYIDSKPFNDTKGAIQEMARLHSRIGLVDASGLREFSALIAGEIAKSPYIAEPVKEALLSLLRGLDTGCGPGTGKTGLCHGDMHPGNFLYDGEKYWLIDWSPSRGDPAADACNTYLYQLRFMPDYAEIYLRTYCEAAKIPREAVLAWLPVIAGYQVNIKTEEERVFILGIINEWVETEKQP